MAKYMEKSFRTAGPTKKGQTVTVQPALTVAAPCQPTKYGQVASNIAPTFNVGTGSRKVGGKLGSKKHY